MIKQEIRDDLKQIDQDSCMIQVSEFSDREFRITIINMSRAVMEREDNAQDQMSRYSKKEPKVNAKSQKHHNRNKAKT